MSRKLCTNSTFYDFGSYGLQVPARRVQASPTSPQRCGNRAIRLRKLRLATRIGGDESPLTGLWELRGGSTLPCCALGTHCLCLRLRILEVYPRRRFMCSPYTCASSPRLRVLRQLCLLCSSGALNEARALQLAGGESAVGPRLSTPGAPI